jgi:hypothetical protein
VVEGARSRLQYERAPAHPVTTVPNNAIATIFSKRSRLAQRTAVKLRPHQQTKRWQMTKAEPVVLHHGREGGGDGGGDARPSASTACWAAVRRSASSIAMRAMGRRQDLGTSRASSQDSRHSLRRGLRTLLVRDPPPGLIPGPQAIRGAMRALVLLGARWRTH